MKLKNFLLSAVIISAAVALPSCSDDDPTPTYTWHPQFGNISSESTTMVTVESGPKPKSGQKHRSSDNFSVNNLKGGNYLLWTTDDPNVEFSVKIDQPGTDGTFETSLHNGAITKFWPGHTYYIADPKNAKDKFHVTITAVDTGTDYLYINAAQTHMEGQSHRASVNFFLRDDKYAFYQVVCPESSISFKIMQDVEVLADKILYEKVSAGEIIPTVDADATLYIADVEGASGPFTITFIPIATAATQWMTALPGNQYLYQLSIPGTHDSGTALFSSGMAKCQNFNFDRQLVDGIRFLDVRLDEDLKIRHGTTDTGLTLQRFLTYANDFLERNPGEAILMSVKSEQGDVSKPFYNYVNEHQNSDVGEGTGRIMTVGAVPTLDEARGKIVLFRRFKNPTSGAYGIDCYSYWPKDGSGETEIDGGKLYVEDRYYDWTEAIHDTKEKKQAVKDALDIATDTDKDDYKKAMFLIFNSVAGRVTHTPWEYAWGDDGLGMLDIDPIMSKALSDNLEGVEKLKHPVRTGVILMDFYNKHGNDDPYQNVQRIINLNFTHDYVPVDR